MTKKEHPVKLYCSNGKFVWKKGIKWKVQALRPLWDDMCIHRKLDIPEGEILDIQNCYQNLYGTFIEVVYHGQTYSVKPKYCEVIFDSSI